MSTPHLELAPNLAARLAVSAGMVRAVGTTTKHVERSVRDQLRNIPRHGGLRLTLRSGASVEGRTAMGRLSLGDRRGRGARRSFYAAGTEFGTWKGPGHAPLRRGVEAAGLRITGRRR